MTSTTRMPAIFFGHGNPMNALADNEYTRAWQRIGATISKPRAVLCISAHWYLPATLLTGMEEPRTIHDFGGFPRQLFEVQYPAPGSRVIASEVQHLLGLDDYALDDQWGLDHGSWSVLCHVYPQADIPVVQMSIDETLPAIAHYELGRRLSPLRDEGILVMGSGNLVHNLHTYAWGRRVQEPYDWAVRFEREAREWMREGNDRPLIKYETLGRDAALAAPTPEHYLPLLYVLGTRHPEDPVTFPVEGVDGGSVSMLTVQMG